MNTPVENSGYVVVQFLPDVSAPRLIPLGILEYHALPTVWKLSFRCNEAMLALARERSLSEGQRHALKDITQFLHRSVEIALEHRQSESIEQLLNGLAQVVGFNFVLSDVHACESEALAVAERLQNAWADKSPRPLFTRELIAS